MNEHMKLQYLGSKNGSNENHMQICFFFGWHPRTYRSWLETACQCMPLGLRLRSYCGAWALERSLHTWMDKGHQGLWNGKIKRTKMVWPGLLPWHGLKSKQLAAYCCYCISWFYVWYLPAQKHWLRTKVAKWKMKRSENHIMYIC